MTTPASNTGDAAGDTYANIENLTGSGFNDTLTGDSGANTLDGGAGSDVLLGGLGADTLIGGTGAGEGNVISGTTSWVGIQLAASAANNTIQGDRKSVV